MVRRSLLFAPGDQPSLLRKAPDAGADTVVFDLEDAVAPSRKDAARSAVADVLADPSLAPDCELCVRVNVENETAARDLEAVLGRPRRVDAVMVPKVDGPDAARAVDALVREHGESRPLFALCESAAGVLGAREIAAVDAVDAVVFGAEDLAADIGATRSEDGEEVAYARQHVVLAAAAGDVDAIDTVFTDIEDTDRLESETRRAIRFGYDGKIAIHPDQVPVINDAFTPDAETVAWAERVLDAREDAAAEGRGVFRVDGEMIDAPLVARAEAVMARHRAADGA